MEHLGCHYNYKAVVTSKNIYGDIETKKRFIEDE